MQKTKKFSVGVNKFTDLTWEEFKNAYLMTPIFNNVKVGKQVDIELDPIDWREKNAVTSVKDQGMCGSCWAFSTAGSMEGYLAIKGHQTEAVSLSTQELMDCSRKYGNMSCNGGEMRNAFKYIIDHGLTTEEKYPYRGRDQKCKKVKKEDKLFIPSFTALENQSTSELSDALKKNPVSIGIEVQSDFQAYTGGVYENENCGSELNHGVLLVGQKDNYYVVKNSWGPDWGEEGYIRIAYREGAGTCGMASHDDVYPVDK